MILRITVNIKSTWSFKQEINYLFFSLIHYSYILRIIVELCFWVRLFKPGVRTWLLDIALLRAVCVSVCVCVCVSVQRGVSNQAKSPMKSFIFMQDFKISNEISRFQMRFQDLDNDEWDFKMIVGFQDCNEIS